MNSFHVETVAWLDASHTTKIGVNMNGSSMGNVKCHLSGSKHCTQYYIIMFFIQIVV